MLICLILIDSFYLILDRILVISFKYVLKPFYHVLQMARTRQTARKSTGGRAFAHRTVPAPAETVPAPAPAPVLAQPEEEVEEVPGRDYFSLTKTKKATSGRSMRTETCSHLYRRRRQYTS